MTAAPRKLLNRLIYIAIGLMTPAIFVCLGLIVWLLMRPDPDQQAPVDQRAFTVGTASVRYTVPEGCVDSVTTAADSIAITFVGETCGGREILALSGDVSLTAE